jgi:hypothetical protein
MRTLSGKWSGTGGTIGGEGLVIVKETDILGVVVSAGAKTTRKPAPSGAAKPAQAQPRSRDRWLPRT